MANLYVENKRGSDCTGADEATNRTLTMANTGSDNTILNIVVNNVSLNSPDFSHNSTTNVITFLNAVYNTDYIRVTYTTEGIVASGTTATYAGTAELQRFMGYTAADNPYTSTQMQEALDRSQGEVDNRTSTHFAVGTTSTPDYVKVTNEKHRGKGNYDRTYFTDKIPLPDVSTTVSGTAVTAADTTIYATSTSGFPATGIVGIEGDKVIYTGKTATSFTGCTGVSSAHGTAKDIKPYVVEISTSQAGASPSWTILTEDIHYDMETDSGRIYVLRDDFVMDVWSTTNPPKIPNRIRYTYIYGYDEIYPDIKRLCLMIASKDLMHTAVRKATGGGMNEFNPAMIDVDEAWINRTIEKYRSHKMYNV